MVRIGSLFISPSFSRSTVPTIRSIHGTAAGDIFRGSIHGAEVTKCPLDAMTISPRHSTCSPTTTIPAPSGHPYTVVCCCREYSDSSFTPAPNRPKCGTNRNSTTPRPSLSSSSLLRVRDLPSSCSPLRVAEMMTRSRIPHPRRHRARATLAPGKRTRAGCE